MHLSSMIFFPRPQCDGFNDCFGGEDESNCTAKACQRGQACANGECLFSKNDFCDGFVDCSDGSDEIECSDVSVGVVVEGLGCGNEEY